MRLVIRALPLLFLAAACFVSPALALGPVDCTAGFDYASGPDGQTTWRPMGEFESDLHNWAIVLGASHFDDNQSGNAWGITGTIKAPVAHDVRLVAAGTGFAGDSTNGAWRGKLGPEFTLAPERTLGIFGAHYDDHAGNTANAIEGEYDTPLKPHLSGSAALALQRSGDLTGVDGTVSLAWNVTDMFELCGDGGVSYNGTGLTGLLPSHSVINIEQNRRGRGPTKKTTAATPGGSATAQLGIRVHF